jgi:hypothetical protein
MSTKKVGLLSTESGYRLQDEDGQIGNTSLELNPVLEFFYDELNDEFQKLMNSQSGAGTRRSWSYRHEESEKLVLICLARPEMVIDWLLGESHEAWRSGVKLVFTAIHDLDVPDLDRRFLLSFAAFAESDAAGGNDWQQEVALEWVKTRLDDCEQWLEFFAVLYRNPSDPAIRATNLSKLHALIDDADELIVQGLPFLVAERTDRFDYFVHSAAVKHADVAAELERLAVAKPYPSIAERCDGLQLQISGKYAALFDVRSKWALDSTLYRAPVPIAPPTSTWMDDRDLEASIRSVVEQAAADLADDAMTSEVMITGAFLKALRLGLRQLEKGVLFASPRRLDVGYSAPNIADEKKNGADVAIVVKISGREMATRRVHFIQVKVPTDASTPTWQIDLAQLDKLRATDSSATYWLIGPRPRRAIYVVPASALKAFISAKTIAKAGQLTVNVNYGLIRSVAVPVQQHLVDLTIGLWLGTDADAALDYVDSSTASRFVGHVFSITIRDGDQ